MARVNKLILILNLVVWSFILWMNIGCAPTPTPTPRTFSCIDIEIEGAWAKIMEDGTTRVITVSTPQECVVEVIFALVRKNSIVPEMAIYPSTIVNIIKYPNGDIDYVLLHHDETLPSDLRSVTFTVAGDTLTYDTIEYERVE